MPPPLRRFRIPARMPARSVVAQLGTELTVSAGAPTSLERVYLDTADWRLYGAGRTLEADISSHSIELRLRVRDTEAVLAAWSAPRVPATAADVPDEAAKVVAERRLLPQLELSARLQQVVVLDDREKTTVRVLMERYLMDDRVPRRIIRAATVLPVRGYERRADRVEALLTAAGLHPFDMPLLASVLRLQKRPAPGTDLGPGVPLRREMPAAHAMSAILGRLRHHVVTNEAGVRDQLDREFLHDYRVAIRRARSMLRRTQGALPAEPARALGEELRWLAGLTSPVRDLDVHMEELEADGREELKPLLAYLADQHVAAHAALVGALDGDRYRRLIGDWEALEGDETGLAAGVPVGRFADEHIGQAYDRVLKRGRAIDDDSPPEALHDLRKRAKELRYLLECFQTLYPDAERTAVVKELKSLQDNLGEFQDCQVQAATLRAMGEDLIHRGAPASTLMAMGRLADEQDARELRAREEFSARFERFASKDNRQRVAGLLHGGSA